MAGSRHPSASQSFIGHSGTSGSRSSVMDAVLSLGCWLGARWSEARDHRQMFCVLLFIIFTLFLFNCPSERTLCPVTNLPDDFKLHAAGPGRRKEGTFLSGTKENRFVFSRPGTDYKNEELGKNNPALDYYRRHLVWSNSQYGGCFAPVQCFSSEGK